MTAPILVTGGAGFMGNWLVRELAARGDVVRVFDLPQAPWSRLPRGDFTAIPGDIRDRAAVARTLQGCRAVIHLAGLPQLWLPQRGRYHQVNVRGAANVLEEAVGAGCERIIHISSATIWPRAGEPFGRWGDAVTPYCRAKHLAEQHALRLARAGAPIVIVSPTVPIGPGDWSKTPPTQMLLDFCRGKRHEYLDTRLNLIDARDAAAGMIAALERGTIGERYLLGNTTLSLLDLFQRLAPIAGQPAPRRRVPYLAALLASIVMEWWADVVSRQTPAASVGAMRLTQRAPPPDGAGDLLRLGVKPRALNESLAETVNWFRAAGWL